MAGGGMGMASGGGMAGGNMGMAGGNMGMGGGNMGMGSNGMGGGGVGGGMAGAMGGGRQNMPPLPPYPQQSGMQPPLPGANMGQGAMPPLPPSGMMDTPGGNTPGLGWENSMGSTSSMASMGSTNSFSEGSQMAQLEMSMAQLGNGPNGVPAAAPEAAVPTVDVGSFLAAALPMLAQIDSFKAQVLHIAPTSDGIVVGVQGIFSALVESRASLPSIASLRTALPSLFGDNGGRSRLTQAVDACEAFEALLGMFTESSDQRFVSTVERHCTMSIMEMCECSCDEMLEPLSYKQTAAYVSVPLLLNSSSDPSGSLVAQLASAAGPLCPTANCGNRMKIMRYLMPAMPNLINICFSWGQTTAQPSVTQTLLAAVPQTIDLQHAFKSVPQPATASVRGLLCSLGSSFFSFSYDATMGSWLVSGDGGASAVGDDWDVVVSHCSLNRYKPHLLVYQVQPSQY
uniref:USP domain-containing protein n=1 Tax=Haptolina brevifila TaxID=156173 RepID=A0A7S2BVN0_9EUKA